MRNKLYILMILFMIVLSCKDSQKPSKTEIKTKTSIKIPTVPTYLISESQVGLFKIGHGIPNISVVYKIDKTEKTRATDSGPVTETLYVLSQNNTKELLLLPKYYTENDDKEVIGEIWVLSGKYKTKEGIGVNSTLEKFMKTYPNFNIWYTYVSDRYVIENSSTGIQFLLDEKDFIGNMKVNEVKVPLKPIGFKKDAQIVKIRVYK